MPHSEIDVLAREIYVVQRGGYAQINARMRLGKTAQSVDQPFGRKIRRGADGNDAGALTLDQALRADGNAIKGISQNHQILPTGLGNYQALALPIEELDAELRFQRFDLMAYCSLGYAQLFSGSCEALIPCGRLESLERVQRWESAEHGSQIMRKTRPWQRNDALLPSPH
jgi:hypothetical protein